MPAGDAPNDFDAAVERNVRDALAEDIGAGDLTAELIDAEAVCGARIVARESCVVAGGPWADAVFRQVDPDVIVDWYLGDGDTAGDGDVVCKLVGRARSILTGERTALNFLQTLSATATTTSRFVGAIAGTGTVLLDTRKTLPGLRTAQKYAVRMGGGTNHRAGLYDAMLIKENHIAAAGSIAAALRAAAARADVPVEIEVESIEEMAEALDAGARRIMLDNFRPDELGRAVAENRRRGDAAAELEASGNVTLEAIRVIAETGVDYISTGAITKNVAAIDFSLRFGIGPGAGP